MLCGKKPAKSWRVFGFLRLDGGDDFVSHVLGIHLHVMLDLLGSVFFEQALGFTGEDMDG